MEEALEDAEEAVAAIVPLSSEFVQPGFQPYVLDLAAAGLQGEVLPYTLAFVVMRRQQGLLLALPELALGSETLEAGKNSGPDDVLGPSTKVEVQAASLSEVSGGSDYAALEGRTMTVLLVDFSLEIVPFLSPISMEDDLSELTPFDVPEDHLFPLPEELVEKALAWAAGARDSEAERISYYSAEDVPVIPPAAVPKRQSRRKGPGPGSTGPERASGAKRKPTVAQLAESIQSIADAMPAITNKLQELSDRTQAIEQGSPMRPAGGRPSALKRPLGLSATPGSAQSLTASQLV